MFEYDILVVGLGPAGMAVSVMGAEMGLSVCAVEKNRIGGECMNVGCIPSKSLLRMAQIRHGVTQAPAMGLGSVPQPGVGAVFEKIQAFLDLINSTKTEKMFEKVHLVLGQGAAELVDGHTVAVAGRRFTARTLFVCVGSRPCIPPIPGIENVRVLTNETVFLQPDIPESLTIIGGGAIGCEMAQAFSRLGTSRVSVVHMDPNLLPTGDADLGDFLEEVFQREGISVYNQRRIVRVEDENGAVALVTDRNERIVSQRMLVAAGRQWDLEDLKLDRAGVKYGKRGIQVNGRLQTTCPSVYAPGDGNGHLLFSHAAMHQGMLALMNSMVPGPLGFRFRNYVVPWTVFTDPQVSAVGLSARELNERGRRYETVISRYGDYGAAIAEGIGRGWVKAFVHPVTGRIYGARIAGEGAGEMIGEWALALQKKIRIWDIMLLQHSFPTMSFLTKRVAETWMMNRMPKWRWLFRRMYGSAQRTPPPLTAQS